MAEDRFIELGEFLKLSAAEQHKMMKVNTDLMLSLFWWLVGYSGLGFRAQEALKNREAPNG